MASASSVVMAIRFTDSEALPALCWLVQIGIVLTLIDWECRLLPRSVVGAAYLGGVVLLGLASAGQADFAPLVRAVLASIVVGFLALALAVGFSPGLGGGDVTLFGTVGLYLGWIGWHEVFVGVLMSFVLAAAAATLLLACRRIAAHDQFAMGPAIVGGALFALLLS
ncbi:prepilin peptidase [Umezawaea sp. NPDC059074]|uniref:prepilin peptidase n=1 Tax=Umezawaea sp. NPDC059074 TaxID=3346716 RepID=UPI0036B3CA07